VGESKYSQGKGRLYRRLYNLDWVNFGHGAQIWGLVVLYPPYLLTWRGKGGRRDISRFIFLLVVPSNIYEEPF